MVDIVFQKDTKQLLSNFGKTPQKLIEAIISANAVRKDFIARRILYNRPNVVGFYRLIMKAGSDNFRSAAIEDVLKRIEKEGVDIVIYEPSSKTSDFLGARVTKDLDEFKAIST